MRKIGLTAWLGITTLALSGGANAAAPHIPNFHSVTPGIYRGGAPMETGLRELKAMGVRTIIDLRYPTRPIRTERSEATQLGLNWINLPMGAEAPTQAQVAKCMGTLKLAPTQPVYIHCQHGADRTGCMIGIWRETHNGWTFSHAWSEMRKYGFNPRWTHLTAAVKSRSSE